MRLEISVLLVCLVVLSATTYKYLDNKSNIMYNCNMAEFHPDYPKQVKQQCRELINENSSM